MKMSLTRVLNEVKVLESRIQKASLAGFIGTTSGGRPPTGFASLEELSAGIKANYSAVKDLISYRNRLKALLVEANATTKVTVAGDVMTIAQAIDRKRTIQLEKNLLQQMNKQFTTLSKEVENHNSKVETNIDSMLLSAFGKDKKVTEEESNAIAVPYRKQHKAELVDPLKIKDQIFALEKSISDFELEVDFSLSEVNAKTEIEVG